MNKVAGRFASRHGQTTGGSERKLLFHVAQASGLSSQTPQVVELGTTNFGRAQQVHFIDDLAIDGEDALDAVAETHLAHGEAGLRTTAARDDHAFERLQTFFIAFLDFYMDADGVTGSEIGNIGALRSGEQLFNN